MPKSSAFGPQNEGGASDIPLIEEFIYKSRTAANHDIRAWVRKGHYELINTLLSVVKADGLDSAIALRVTLDPVDKASLKKTCRVSSEHGHHPGYPVGQ